MMKHEFKTSNFNMFRIRTKNKVRQALLALGVNAFPFVENKDQWQWKNDKSDGEEYITRISNHTIRPRSK